jgi:hypothetical protein
MGTYYQGGSPANYTIGGVRFWFNRLADDQTTPVRYEGYQDMGNVVESSDEQATEEQDHYTAKTGVRIRDRSLVKQIEEEIVFTLDELSTENLRSFFRGSDVADVAAATGVAVTNEVMQAVGEEVRILGKGYNASSIVVKDISGSPTHVEDTDYTVVDIIGGYKGIKRIDGGGISDGDFLLVDYDYDIRAHKRFNPGTNLEVKGEALFFGVSDTGNEFIRSIALGQLEPEGAFSLNDDDWSNFQLRLKILDNSAAVAALRDWLGSVVAVNSSRGRSPRRPLLALSRGSETWVTPRRRGQESRARSRSQTVWRKH